MLTALMVLSLLATSNDPQGVITTAPGGVQSVSVDAVAPVSEVSPSVSLQSVIPHGLSTPEQIDLWVGSQADLARPFASDRDPFAFRDDRKMHGEVTAGIGTNDYSAFGARVSIPFGESGRVDLSYSQSKNSPFGYGYGHGRGGLGGYDPRFGPGYRGHYDPFFLGEGVVSPGRFRPWHLDEGRIPVTQDKTPDRATTND